MCALCPVLIVIFCFLNALLYNWLKRWDGCSPYEATEQKRKWTVEYIGFEKYASKYFSAVTFARPYGSSGKGSSSADTGFSLKWLKILMVDIFTKRSKSLSLSQSHKKDNRQILLLNSKPNCSEKDNDLFEREVEKVIKALRTDRDTIDKPPDGKLW